MKRVHGSGSVTPHRGGYRARLPRAYDRRSLGVYPTEAEARAILDASLAQLAGTELPPELTVDAWGKRWLREREAAGEHKARTVRRDRTRWKTRVSGSLLGQLALIDATERDVRAWVASLTKADGTRPSPSTLSNALTLVRGAFEAALLAGRIDANPARHVKLSIPQRRKRKARARDEWTWLSPEEIDRVLGCDAIPLRARAAYATAIYAGLRAGELWGLRWSDVDMRAGILHVRRSFEDTPKSHQERSVGILPPLHAWLDTWRRAYVAAGVRSLHGLVWPGRDAGYHADGYDAGWAEKHRAAAKIRASVRLHDLRHTCASHLIQGTWSPRWVDRPLRLEEVRDWLGHEDITTTQRYAHLSPESIRALVAAPETPSEAASAGTQPGHGFEATYQNRTGDLRFTKPSLVPTGAGPNDHETSAVSRDVSRMRELAVRAARAMASGDVHRNARVMDLIEAVLEETAVDEAAEGAA